MRFIRRARDLGLSIERIKLLVGLWQDRERSSGDVKRVAEEHIAELETKILELTATRDSLRDLADACHGDHRPECPILRDLEGGAGRAPARKAGPRARERQGHHLEAHQRGHRHNA